MISHIPVNPDDNLSLTEESWTSHLRDLFASATSAHELLVMASEIQRLKHFSGAWSYGIPRWREYYKKFVPNPQATNVVAVDLNAIVHASWYVKGADAEWPIIMLRNIYTETSPDIWIVGVDKNAEKRIKYEEYKSSREPKPDSFYQMFDDVVAYLQQKGVHLEIHDGYEADDVMCSIAFRCQIARHPCILVTEDKDSWQSLGPSTALYSPRNKEFRNATWLKGKHGITPSQAVDWVALVGGKNDIPGAEGIGKDTATRLLEAYEDVPGIVQHADKLSEKKREGIMEFYNKHYWRVKEIHTLYRTLPIGWASK